MAAALLLAFASLVGKVASEGRAAAAPEGGMEGQLVEFLAGNGWSPIGSHEFIADQRLNSFEAPGCARAIQIALVPLNGDLLPVLEGSRGPDYRLAVVEQGVVRESPSRFGYIRARLRASAAQLGLVSGGHSMLTVAIEPEECDAVGRLPWHEF